jgi:plastocyanin
VEGRRAVVARVTLLMILAVATTRCRGEVEPVALPMIAGELRDDSDAGGFALEGEELTSPGPTLRVPAGAEVTITLHNQHGAFSGEEISHNIAIVADKDAVPHPRFESEIDPVNAGETGSVTFTAGEPGTYFYVCTLVGHVGRGMYGEFIVEG